MKSLALLLFIPLASSPLRYKQLTWADFKGAPEKSNVLARTCSGIVIEKDTAYAIFEPDKSWTRTTDVATLRHEQLHFTITKFWAEDISRWRKEWHGTEEINSKVQYFLEEWDSWERQYDKETDHGNNLEKQKAWEQFINEIVQ